MQDIVKHLIRMFPVNLVSALDAEVQGWRRLRGEGDGYSVVVTNLPSLSVACVRAGASLAHEGREIV